MNKVIVLGGGMVGSAMAIDLAKKHHVLLTDIDQNALNKAKQKCNELNILELNVNDEKSLKETIINFDLVVSAVPGFLGFKTLRNIIEALYKVSHKNINVPHERFVTGIGHHSVSGAGNNLTHFK